MRLAISAAAIGLALQCVAAHAAQGTVESSGRDSAPVRLEAQDRSKGIIQNHASQSGAGRKSGTVAGICISMRDTARGSSATVDGLAPPQPESKSAQKRGTARSDCDPATAPRGNVAKVVTVPRDRPEGMEPQPGDAIARGKQRAENERARRQEALMRAIEQTAKEKKCKNKICPVFETMSD